MDENMTQEQEVQNDIPHEVSDPGNNSKDSPTKVSSNESKKDESEEDWLDILGNGQLKKRVIKKGKQDYQPRRGDMCVLNVVGKLDDGTTVEEYRNMSIQLGDLEIVQVL